MDHFGELFNQLGIPSASKSSGHAPLSTLHALAMITKPNLLTAQLCLQDMVEDRRREILHQMKLDLVNGASGWSFALYTDKTGIFMAFYLYAFQNSGDQSDAREVFELSLGIACMAGDCDLPSLNTGVKCSPSLAISVIVCYLVDYPRDFRAVLQAVAYFGTPVIMCLFRAPHRRATLRDLHSYARSLQHMPLPYPKFLFHLLSAAIVLALSGTGTHVQLAVFASIVRSFDITSMVVNELKDFTNCPDQREYYYRYMVLHYVYYARHLRPRVRSKLCSNDASDLYESLKYRLSADALFPRPLDPQSRRLELLFLSEIYLDGRHYKKVWVLLRHYLPSPPVHSEAGTSLDNVYDSSPFMSLHGGYKPTIERGMMFLKKWIHDDYDGDYLENAAEIFEKITSLQSVTDEEREEAQQWLTFISSKPDRHAFYIPCVYLQTFGQSDCYLPEISSRMVRVVSQWLYAAKEGNLLRLVDLLPLIQAAAETVDACSENIRYCKHLESISTIIAGTIDELDPVGLNDFRQAMISFAWEEIPVTLEQHRERALAEVNNLARLRSALDWAQCALRQFLPESLAAFQVFALLLQDNIRTGSILEQKHHILSSEHWSDTAVTTVVRHGGRLSTAVEYLEQSRSTTYQHLLHLRQSSGQLGDIHPGLDRRWLHLSSRIQSLLEARTRNINLLSTDRTYRSVFIATFSQLQIAHHELLKEIRKRRGFEDFFRPLKYDILSNAAAEGPVIMFSSDPQTQLSHALIILLGREHPLHIQLPKEASFTELLRCANDLGHWATENGQRTRQGWEIDAQPSDKDSLHFYRILEWLWDHVVRPVLYALATVGYTSGRVWWCPSGNFTLLPLHAAALLHPYQSIISSYTPSLEALVDSRRRGPASNDTMMPRRLAAIGLQSCPRRADLHPLHSVKEELGIFFGDSDGWRRTIEGRKFEGCDAQVRSVLAAMRSSHIVHFACHGVQDSVDPLNSHLVLYDDELSLRALMTENLSCAEFAFLSACQTTTGHRELANESVHLAGGFIAAGFKGVVGTLWPIADRDPPRVVRKVYEHMVTEEGGFDVRKAAEGLHLAVLEMIKHGLPPRRWAPFIHVGI